MLRKSPVGIVIIFGLASAFAVAQNPRPSELALGLGGVSRLVSPDGKWVLSLLPFHQGGREGPELWFEDVASGQKQLLLTLGGTLTARWSLDSKAFAVNDHLASDTENGYLYDAATLERVDVGKKIIATEPQLERFRRGHAYFAIESWQDPSHVLVRFFGHTDVPPVDCFNFRYVVTRDGTVTRVSELVGPVGGVACN